MGTGTEAQAQGEGWDSEGTRSPKEAAAGAQRCQVQPRTGLQCLNPLFQVTIGVQERAGGRGEGASKQMSGSQTD